MKNIILASTLYGLTACGGGGSTPDADPNGDPNLVTVLVTEADDTPIAGATVIFHDASGAVVDEGTTDATGKATSEQADGGQATVAWEPDVDRRKLITVALVNNGEVIYVKKEQDLSSVGSVDITFDNMLVNTDKFFISNGCDEQNEGFAQNNTVTLDVDPSCVHGGTVNVLVTAQDQDGNILAYSMTPITAPTGGNTTSGNASAWSTEIDMWEFQITNGNAFALGGLMESNFTMADEQYSFDPDVNGAVAGGNLTLNVPYPKDATAHMAMVGLANEATNYFTGSLKVFVDQPDTAKMTMDATTDLMPPMTSISIIEGANAGVTWDYPGDETSIDGAFVELEWTDGSNVRHSWTILTPVSANDSVTAPVLPASLATWEPPATGAAVFFLMVEAEFLSDFGSLVKWLTQTNLQDGPPPKPGGGATEFNVSVLNRGG